MISSSQAVGVLQQLRTRKLGFNLHNGVTMFSFLSTIPGTAQGEWQYKKVVMLNELSIIPLLIIVGQTVDGLTTGANVRFLLADKNSYLLF